MAGLMKEVQALQHLVRSVHLTGKRLNWWQLFASFSNVLQRAAAFFSAFTTATIRETISPIGEGR